MADRSTNVVYAALAGNVMVAASKFAAASISGSSAMLTEAIHSSADTANQILLLIGSTRRGERAVESRRSACDTCHLPIALSMTPFVG
jgi:divalent metal cation (Fe/Co/Zn/Cd) transporter